VSSSSGPFNRSEFPEDCAGQRIQAGDLVLTSGGRLFRSNTGQWLFASAPLFEATELAVGKRGILAGTKTDEWVRTMDALVVLEADLGPAVLAARYGENVRLRLRSVFSTLYRERDAGQRARSDISHHRDVVRRLREQDETTSGKESDDS